MNEEQSLHNNLNLESIMDCIEMRKLGTITLEFPKMYGGWYEFLQTTDIGRIIAQNNHYLFRDLYHDRKLKGAFIKLDDETFIQVVLLGSERSTKTGVCIDIFPVQQLKNRVFNAYVDFDRVVNITKDFNEIFNLRCFEIQKEEEKNIKN